MDARLLSRRDWLAQSSATLAVVAFRVSGRRESRLTTEDLVLNVRGGYRFIPGVPFLSFGVVAADGFEIVRTTFRQPRPFAVGMADVERLLQGAGRPLHALCGLELRSPRPLSREEFGEFNQAYVARLKAAGLLVGDDVPVTRTNVASGASGTPANGMSGAPEVTIHACSYTVPTVRGVRPTAPTFVLAGMPEIRNLRDFRNSASRPARPDIVAANDTTPSGLPTPAALRQKTEFILTALAETMRTLGVAWTDVTGVQLYTLHDVQPLLADLILPRLGVASRLGVEWHHTLPPGVQVEIGVRGIRREITV
jgi:hypothetical protein